MTGRDSSGEPPEGRETASRIRLHTAPDVDLEETDVADTIIAAAHAAAERIGVSLQTAAFEHDGLVLEVEGPMLVAIGLAAELRRSTDHWHRERTGRHLWIAPEDESTP